MSERILENQISLSDTDYKRDVGRLYQLLIKGIDLVDSSNFQAGQGDSPSPEEEERMQDAKDQLEKVATEIFLGLTGKTCHLGSPARRVEVPVMIGNLDTCISQMLAVAKDQHYYHPTDIQTVKHHAEDMILSGQSVLKKLGKDKRKEPSKEPLSEDLHNAIGDGVADVAFRYSTQVGWLQTTDILKVQRQMVAAVLRALKNRGLYDLGCYNTVYKEEMAEYDTRAKKN
jgi:hypothetical protein